MHNIAIVSEIPGDGVYKIFSNQQLDAKGSSQPGSALICEIYHTFNPEGLVASVVDICASQLEEQEEDGDEGDLTLFEDLVGHLAVKNLLLSDLEKEEKLKEGSCFAVEFFKKLKSELMDVAKSNRGALVLSALCKVPSVRDDVIKILRKQTAKIKEFTNKAEHRAGYEALLKEIEK